MEDIVFNGIKYVLNQCECAESIWDWFLASAVGEFTRYYSYTIIHTAEGFWAAYSDNLQNGVFV